MSGNYLLLRDNKESGPYSLDDIKTMGLKKYDLIWVDGKSAAWRYPCELEEFKSFAPQVDEQPFDRFFKKPSQQEHYQFQGTAENKKVEEDALKKEAPPVKKNTEVKKISARKYVSISLPGSYRVKIDPIKPDPLPVKAKEEEEVKDLTEQKPLLAPIFPAEKKTNRLEMSAATVEDIAPVSNLPVHIPRSTSWSANDLIQYTALGMGVLTILMVGYLLLTGYGEPVLTVPPATPVVKKAVPAPAAAPEAGSIPNAAVQETIDNNLPQQNEKESAGSTEESLNTLPVKKTTVVRFNDDQLAASEKGNAAVTSLASAVNVSLNNYKVGMFGGLNDIKLTLHNNSAFRLDLVVVELQYLQNNNKVFKTETIRFKNVEAGAKPEIKAPDTPRGIKLKTRISYITSSAAGISENL